jgi:DNA-binding MarR family transcriptional regulator
MNEIVRRLVSANMLARQVHPEHGRVIQLYLTPGGQAALGIHQRPHVVGHQPDTQRRTAWPLAAALRASARPAPWHALSSASGLPRMKPGAPIE